MKSAVIKRSKNLKSKIDLKQELNVPVQAWYAEFLLEIDLKILLRKAGARLIFKIALISLHIDSGP
jgi:hypothetical protein